MADSNDMELILMRLLQANNEVIKQVNMFRMQCIVDVIFGFFFCKRYLNYCSIIDILGNSGVD